MAELVKDQMLEDEMAKDEMVEDEVDINLENHIKTCSFCLFVFCFVFQFLM